MKKCNSNEVMDVIQNVEHIGIIPSISLHLYNASLKSNFDCKEAAFYIKKDPGIASQLLKVSNSAFYTHGNKITSVDHAIAYLGLEMVRNLIFTIEMAHTFKLVNTNNEFNSTQLWKSTLAGAMLAQELANSSDREIADTIYLSALLRNIGLLFLINDLPDLFKEVVRKCETEKVSYSKATDDICGYDFRYIAYLIGYKWDLPKTIIDTFREGFFPLGNKIVNDIYSYIFLSENLLYAADYEVWDSYYEPASFDSFAKTKLDLSSIKNTVKKTLEIVENVASTFLIT